MDDEFESILEEGSLDICLQGLSKISRSLTVPGVLVGIGKERSSNTKLHCYCYSLPCSVFLSQNKEKFLVPLQQTQTCVLTITYSFIV